MPIYPIANLSLLQPPRSPKRKLEDKALKEKRNQAAGQQLKASSGVLKREKPITTSGRSAKSSSTDKSTISKRASSSKTGVFISNCLFNYWFIKYPLQKLIIFCFPAGGIHPSTSKTKKEATNKTKKEEVSRKVSEEKNKKETAAAAASEAANAAATVVASNAAEIPATDENQENEDGPRKMSAVLSGKMISLFC